MAKKFDFLSPGVQLNEIDESALPAVTDAEGPVIIGRTLRGPAMVPTKVRSLEDFVSVFGPPVPGGGGLESDVWRNPGLSAPTYASYAAQAWLASNNSPVTMVRVLGDQADGASAGGIAGWATTSNNNSALASNGGAYGLFLIDSGSASDMIRNVTGSLAAIFYVDSGALMLKGVNAGSNNEVSGAAKLIKSNASNAGFQIEVRGADNTVHDTVNFDFSRNRDKYIRNAFNTNPTLTHASLSGLTTPKTYWLGENIERSLGNHIVETAAAGAVYGILLGLHSGSVTTGPHYHKEGMKKSRTGWFISQDFGPAASYSAENAQKLFYLEALQDGTNLEKNTVVTIEDLQLPSNPTIDPYSSFTLKIADINGSVLEEYRSLNFNPSSRDFIARRIGDYDRDWSDTDTRYRVTGDYPNNSDYVRVVLEDSIKDNGPERKNTLPFGFFGPVRPKGFAIMSGSIASIDPGQAAFPGAFAHGSGSVYMDSVRAAQDLSNVAVLLGADLAVDMTASFVFPSIELRGSGTEGGASNPYTCTWGIRPTLSDTSTALDSDYVDYVRRGGSAYHTHTATGDFEDSFVFSLDDIVVDATANTVTYTSGSRHGSTSYTATNSVTDLLNKKIRKFAAGFSGGFNGFDIKEKEPLRNGLLTDGSTNTSNFVFYSLAKALDSVNDPEGVPCNLMLVPGINKPIITNKLINVCENRTDALAIVDLENDYVPSVESADSAATRRGSVDSAVTSLRNRNIDSSYSCCFYPWVQVQDTLGSAQRVWVPSSVAALGAFASSEAGAELWFAPAGFNRGGLGNLGGPQGPRVVQARQRLDVSERDKLYAQNINPIATFPNEGVVIFGQKTLQSTPSALDRINVRRLMIFLKGEVGKISRNLLFDQNVSSTWNRFKSQVEPLLAGVQARFGITEYKLVLDETTTTPDLIDRNIMYAKIYLKPARAIEYIVVDFVITRTGADFA